MKLSRLIIFGSFLLWAIGQHSKSDDSSTVLRKEVDATSLRRKVLCGYQGWFRCPGDTAKENWRHWSFDSARLSPETVSFEMWPDLTEFEDDEKYLATGFTEQNGTPASLFSSANAKTVERHFRWMQKYGIDGVFLQHFVVDLPGGPMQNGYASRMQVLNHVVSASRETGRVWGLAYDISGTPGDQIFEVLTADWKRMVDSKMTVDPRYIHEQGKPVVKVWGFYRNSPGNQMTSALAHRLIDFFKAPGPYHAFLVGGGDWDWRRDEDLRGIVHRFDAYCPWNVANYRLDEFKVKHASTDWWQADRKECLEHGVMWLPVVYPGFGWDNLKHAPVGSTTIPRLGGEFYWEQFRDLAAMGVEEAYVAMFDEVDEGTAIFKVSNSPPTSGHFATFDGLPSDWYLRLTGEGTKMLRGERPMAKRIPITP